MLYQLSYASMTTFTAMSPTSPHGPDGPPTFAGRLYYEPAPAKSRESGAQSPDDGGSQAFRSFRGSTNVMLPTQFASSSADRLTLHSGLSSQSRKQ